MSEAKGPYWVECPDDEILLTVFPNGRKVDRIGGFSLCDALNEAYANGMAARDGLRKALADLFSVVNSECPSLLNEDSGGASYLYLQIKEALEADGEVGK